jgi:SAM-dependent methyltransferase
MTIEKLKSKYYGDVAEKYNARRENSEKWKKEHHAVERMLARFAGDMVLDLPCGTGRFMELYRQLNCRVIASDVSTDMLNQARREAAQAGIENARFEVADALTMNPENLKADVVVSIRFMNWLSPDHARRAFSNLCACGRKAIIIGIRSIDLETTSGEQRRKAERRLQSTLAPRLDGRPHNYLHLRSNVDDWFRNERITVRRSEFIEKTAVGADYFVYELER